MATPLLVLGGVCLAILWLGRWLKRIAGEAAESLKRTSEAHFIGLLELQKSVATDEVLLDKPKTLARHSKDTP